MPLTPPGGGVNPADDNNWSGKQTFENAATDFGDGYSGTGLTITSAGALSSKGNILSDTSVLSPKIEITGSSNGYIEAVGSNYAFYRGIGNAMLVIDGAGVQFKAGSAGAPGLRPIGDNNTGFFFDTAEQLAIACAGLERIRFADTFVKSAVPILVPDGTVGAPSITNTGDLDTGSYFPAADQIGVVAGGAEIIRADGSGATDQLLVFPDGTLTLPAVAWDDDTNTGIRHPAADEFAITCGGADQAHFTTTDQQIGGTLFTAKGGHAHKLINKTGAATIKGTVVMADTTTDNAFKVATISEKMPIGVVYEAGVADGSEAWVVYTGKAEVLLEDSTNSTRGDWCRTSDTTAGRMETTTTQPGAILAHSQEVGHCLEVDGANAGTDVLIDITVHFN